VADERAGRLTSPSVIVRLLKRKGIRLRRRMGQHFLADQNIADKIVEASGATRGSRVFEIGAGIGTLTAHLANRAGQVVAVEMDEALCAILEETTAQLDNVTVLREDIMKLPLEQALGGPARWTVVADLPYYITTPVLFRLLENLGRIQLMVLMVQKEVGERIGAQPGDRRRGALSVAVQAKCEVDRICIVPSTCFFPRPRVDSMIIRLTPLHRPLLEPAEEAAFRSLVQASFGRRRKMLSNALQGPPLGLSRHDVDGLLDSCSIDGKSRAETLDTEDFVAMARIAARMKGGKH
jgi:16S rRNA (adenine1518-N6/adenine1519-N6)-dimethyltransferase